MSSRRFNMPHLVNICVSVVSLSAHRAAL